MRKILFVCTGNTCRSPMAEGIFNHICKNESLPYVSRSAGLFTCTGLPVAENSVKALAESGIDISSLTATAITDLDLDDFFLIAVMTPEHRDILRYYDVPSGKIYILAEDTGGISDPYGGSKARYMQCRDEIEQAVKTLTEQLKKEI